MKKIAILALLLSLPLSVGASTSNSTRTDTEFNDTSPFIGNVIFNSDIVVSDECYTGEDPEFEGSRFRIYDNELSDNELFAGFGDQNVNSSISLPAGHYAPFIYFFAEGADLDNREEACSAGEIWAPFYVEEEEDIPASPSTVEPSGVVWAMSALSIIMLAIGVYFITFFMIIGVIFWGIIQVLNPIFRLITYGD